MFRKILRVGPITYATAGGAFRLPPQGTGARTRRRDLALVKVIFDRAAAVDDERTDRLSIGGGGRFRQPAFGPKWVSER